eukprot:s2011_g10.t1
MQKKRKSLTSGQSEITQFAKFSKGDAPEHVTRILQWFRGPDQWLDQAYPDEAGSESLSVVHGVVGLYGTIRDVDWDDDRKVMRWFAIGKLEAQAVSNLRRHVDKSVVDELWRAVKPRGMKLWLSHEVKLCLQRLENDWDRALSKKCWNYKDAQTLHAVCGVFLSIIDTLQKTVPEQDFEDNFDRLREQFHSGFLDSQLQTLLENAAPPVNLHQVQPVVLAVEQRQQRELEEEQRELTEKYQRASCDQLIAKLEADFVVLKGRAPTKETEAAESLLDAKYLKDRQRTLSYSMTLALVDFTIFPADAIYTGACLDVVKNVLTMSAETCAHIQLPLMQSNTSPSAVLKNRRKIEDALGNASLDVLNSVTQLYDKSDARSNDSRKTVQPAMVVTQAEFARAALERLLSLRKPEVHYYGMFREEQEDIKTQLGTQLYNHWDQSSEAPPKVRPREEVAATVLQALAWKDGEVIFPDQLLNKFPANSVQRSEMLEIKARLADYFRSSMPIVKKEEPDSPSPTGAVGAPPVGSGRGPSPRAVGRPDWSVEDGQKPVQCDAAIQLEHVPAASFGVARRTVAVETPPKRKPALKRPAAVLDKNTSDVGLTSSGHDDDGHEDHDGCSQREPAETAAESDAAAEAFGSPGGGAPGKTAAGRREVSSPGGGPAGIAAAGRRKAADLAFTVGTGPGTASKLQVGSESPEAFGFLPDLAFDFGTDFAFTFGAAAFGFFATDFASNALAVLFLGTALGVAAGSAASGTAAVCHKLFALAVENCMLRAEMGLSLAE